jgi:hypothetical protein
VGKVTTEKYPADARTSTELVVCENGRAVIAAITEILYSATLAVIGLLLATGLIRL